MYTSVKGIGRLPAPLNGSRRTGPAVSSTVVLLGLTSLFTDISSEMVVAVLPLYTTVALGLSPLQFGIVDGVYQGAAALFRVVAGYTADRTRRPKAVATTGYLLSAATKPALLLVGGLAGLTAVLGVDRAGKGIRTAPRDAMIVASTPPGRLGQAFGVHRSMDTVGAMAGPLVAFAVLSALPGSFDAVFVTSFCFALVGVAIIALLVEERAADFGVSSRTARDSRTVRFRDALALVRNRDLMRASVAASLLAVVTISDGFLYLSLSERHDIPIRLFPLLFLVTATTYILLAVPLGWVADRIGRARVFIAGHVVLIAAYLVVLAPATSTTRVILALSLVGAYYAATDGVLSALTSRLLPESLQSSGLAVVQTGVTMGKVVAALAFGALWTYLGLSIAITTFAVGLAAAVAASCLLLPGATNIKPASR